MLTIDNTRNPIPSINIDDDEIPISLKRFFKFYRYTIIVYLFDNKPNEDGIIYDDLSDIPASGEKRISIEFTGVLLFVSGSNDYLKENIKFNNLSKNCYNKINKIIKEDFNSEHSYECISKITNNYSNYTRISIKSFSINKNIVC